MYFLCYIKGNKGDDILLSISEYIKTHEELKDLDFVTAYSTIIALLNDKRMEWNFEKEIKTNV